MRSRVPLSKFELDREELIILLDYGSRANLTGGYETFCKMLLHKATIGKGVMEFTDEELGRLMRYATQYKRGGFQDSCLRPVFRRVLAL